MYLGREFSQTRRGKPLHARRKRKESGLQRDGALLTVKLIFQTAVKEGE